MPTPTPSSFRKFRGDIRKWGVMTRPLLLPSPVYVWFDVEWGFVNYPTEPAIRRGAEKCSVKVNRLTCSYSLNHPHPNTVVTDVSIYVVPRDSEYGGSHYGGKGITGRQTTVSGHYPLN